MRKESDKAKEIRVIPKIGFAKYSENKGKQGRLIERNGGSTETKKIPFFLVIISNVNNYILTEDIFKKFLNLLHLT